MALLVFLAAAAWAWIVSAHLRFVSPHCVYGRVVAAHPSWPRRSRRQPSARGGACRTRGEPGGRRWRARRRGKRSPWLALGLIEGHGRRGPALRAWSGFIADDRELADPEPVHHVFVDAPLHVLEQLEAFFLVLDERIFLPVSAQTDPFLEMVEAVEVILPLTIDDLEHDESLDLPHRFGADQRFLRLVFLEDAIPQRIADLLGGLVAESEPNVVAGIETEDARHIHLQRIEIPLLGIHFLPCVCLDGIVEDVLGKHQ